MTWKLNEKYLHGMANKTKGRCVSRTCVIRTSAVQQAVEHPSVLTGPITGPTAEERMGAVGEENTQQAQELVVSVWKKGNVWGAPVRITSMTC